MRLVRYDAACKALAAAKAVDEVKDLRDKADAMRIYAMQAKNKQLEVDAAEIRIRAERRLGELIQAQKETVGLNRGSLLRGSDEEPRDERPTLADVGIDKKLSSRAQALAAVPEEEFESEVSEWRDRVEQENARVTTRLVAAGERAQNGKAKPKTPDDNLRAENAELRAHIAELEEKVTDLVDSLENQEDAKLEEQQQRIKFAQLREKIRVLESQLNEQIHLTNQWKREANALRKKLGC